ncbi:MAG: acetate--CoA ligase [Candidatus Dadabacteria bacterium]|nr:MAG: acetate--CoA ligase [Candidatus Dadabacteria bacterium]
MSKSYDIPERVLERAYIKPGDYNELYEESISNPDKFWGRLAEEFISWEQKWDKVSDCDYSKAQVRWFEGAKLSVCYNCLDRHLETRGDKTAIIWEGNEPGEVKSYTYRDLHREVCRFANLLKAQGVKRGDRVAIYLPMIPELAISMLACARIGAIHSVIFGGFSADSIRDRILDSTCKLVITANQGLRANKKIPLKDTVDRAVDGLDCVEKVLVCRRTDADVTMKEGRDLWIEEQLQNMSAECPCEIMDAEDPLFILYTSGSTGKPKGVLHTQGGYLLYTSVTHKYVFDYHEEDVYFCAADIGWITGHSYIVYGPLCNGATTLMFESIPTYPDAGRYWDVVSRHKVNIFYTAPTAIRAIAKEGREYVDKYDLSSLRILGTVGEPINEDAWLWYYEVVGKKQCAIVDTWWQTETGGILITPLPGAIPTKPGSATKPFFGIKPCIVDSDGNRLEGNNVSGYLCIERSWPGQMRTVYGDHQRFFDTYFSQYPGLYFTGDAAMRDQDGYYWIRGRVDDVLNVSGHRLGTAEIESAIVHSGVVAEAAVVGMPHDIKGTGIYAYCVLKNKDSGDEEDLQKIKEAVREVIGPIATPDCIQFVPGLPKTRSGKIMRRILRKIARGDTEDLGDTTTLADPSVVDQIIAGSKTVKR